MSRGGRRRQAGARRGGGGDRGDGGAAEGGYHAIDGDRGDGGAAEGGHHAMFAPELILLAPTFYLLIQTMVKKTKPTDNASSIESTHVGLLQKSASAGASAKWHSPGEESKKRQPNLFGCGSLKVVKEEAMLQEEVLMDGKDIYSNGVPEGLEGRFYRYRIDSWNQGKKNTFDLTYLDQCVKSDAKEWISLPDDSADGSGKVLTNVNKDLVLEAHVRMRETQASIREYRRQKDSVLKASLIPIKNEPVLAQDVNCDDIIWAANSDRVAGWASYNVLQVCCVLLV